MPRCLQSALLVLLALAHGVRVCALQLRPPPARRTALGGVAMAGFGAAPKKGAKKKAAAPLSPKKQWDRYKALVKGGATPCGVFARARGDEAWVKVGSVAVAPDPRVSLPAGVAVHKRLILEHAVRVAPKLSPKAKELECGFAVGDAAPKALERPEPAAAADAGFEGLPDPSARYGGQQASEAVNLEFGLTGKNVV